MSPPGDYSQQIPSKTSKHRVVPPVLPSHLLQIVLNQEIPHHVSIFLKQVMLVVTFFESSEADSCFGVL
jgi:hypothetical protein